MDIHEIVKKLVGEINPIGETTTDERRFENLQEMVGLVDNLLGDIDSIAHKYKNNHQHSMKKASKYASDFFDKLGIKE